MAKKDFESTLTNLEKIVQSLEAGEMSLDDSVKKFEEEDNEEVIKHKFTFGMNIANNNNFEKSIELSQELLTFRLVEGNSRYKQRVMDLLNLSLKLKSENH